MYNPFRAFRSAWFARFLDSYYGRMADGRVICSRSSEMASTATVHDTRRPP